MGPNITATHLDWNGRCRQVTPMPTVTGAGLPACLTCLAEAHPAHLCRLPLHPPTHTCPCAPTPWPRCSVYPTASSAAEMAAAAHVLPASGWWAPSVLSAATTAPVCRARKAASRLEAAASAPPMASAAWPVGTSTKASKTVLQGEDNRRCLHYTLVLAAGRPSWPACHGSLSLPAAIACLQPYRVAVPSAALRLMLDPHQVRCLRLIHLLWKWGGRHRCVQGRQDGPVPAVPARLQRVQRPPLLMGERGLVLVGGQPKR